MKKTMCSLLLSAACVSPVLAQDFPTRPIRFVVPYVAGGAGDIFARAIGQKMGEYLGVQVVIDNRGGANGIIGTDIVAKSPPDGYTMVMGNSGPFVLNPSLYRKLPYDPVKDFAPVTQGTYYAYTLILHPSFPARSTKELVARAKAQPGAIVYGSTGTGSANHLAGELFGLMTGTRYTHVPYKGSALSLTDVLAGQIPMMFDTPITSAAHVRAGRLRALGFTGSRRTPLLPDVPTLAEQGLTGYEVSSWQGVLVPAGTSRQIVERLHRESVRALKAPDVIERLATQGGNELIGNTPAEFAALIRDELTRYAKLIRDAGITIEQP